MRDRVYIGCGAGFAEDRWDGAIPVVDTLSRKDGPCYLTFEMLAVRTMALAQLRRLENPDHGYVPDIARFLRSIIGPCLEHSIPIVGNFGAANPRGAAAVVRRLASELGIDRLRIAIVEGDNLMDGSDNQLTSLPGLQDLGPDYRNKVVSANVYLGAKPIAQAIAENADVVITGRVADSALVLAPLVHEFQWDWRDWDLMAAGSLVGHLLECGAQISGGYFADPGVKDVSDLANVGFPIAEVDRKGEVVVGKAENTGGIVSEQTVKEQLLYEVMDPSEYIMPDVVVDLSEVSIAQEGRNRVRVRGAKGRERPEKLKAIIGLKGGWLGEGEISYAGANAFARARLAVNVLRERIAHLYPELEVHTNIIGHSSVFSSDKPSVFDDVACQARDLRVRIALQSLERSLVEDALREVDALQVNGPAGGGGVRCNIRRRLGTASAFVDRSFVRPNVSLVD